MRPRASSWGGVSAGRLGSRAAGVLFAAVLLACASTRGAMGCAAVPDPVRDINAVDYRTGPGGMTIDSSLRARNDAAMEPQRIFVRIVSSGADHYIADNKTTAADCVLTALRDWANGGALLGAMANSQADRERSGLTSGIAFAYLKTKDAASLEDQQTIEAWLNKLASGVESAFGDPARPANRSLALAGLATMAVGVATGNGDHQRFGEAAFDQSARAIDEQGVLEIEMGGGERALFDQDFALGNLVMTAELAAKQSGEDWYSRHDGALHHLADRVLDGLHDPSWFAERTGKQQFLPSGRDLAWIAFYARRFPDRFAGRVPDGAIFQSPRLGGDLTVLAEKWVKG